MIAMDKKLTRRRQSVLDFIKAYNKLHGISPSYEALAKGFKMKSRSNMHKIVMTLVELGYLEYTKRKFYSIKIVEKE
jgi:SOS-response transcriptional repressor LexA